MTRRAAAICNRQRSIRLQGDRSGHQTPIDAITHRYAMFLITWLLGGTVPSKRTIKQYEYKSPPLSLFERLFLDRFWGALPGAG